MHSATPLRPLSNPALDAATGELWSDHPSLPLRVSTHGRVMNPKTGKVIGSPSASGGKGRRAKVRPYILVTTYANGVKVTKRRSALVLETFISDRPEGCDADHGNHIRTDDSLANLTWRDSGLNRGDTWRGPAYSYLD